MFSVELLCEAAPFESEIKKNKDLKNGHNKGPLKSKRLNLILLDFLNDPLFVFPSEM